MIDPISVILNRADYMKFSRYSHKNHYFTKDKTNNLPFLVLVMIFVVACVFTFRYFNATLPIIFTSFLLAVLLFITFALRLVQVLNKAIPDDNGFLFTEREYCIDEEGIHEKSIHGTSLIKWSAVQYIRTDGDLLYLYLDRIYAIIIPARSFASEQASQQFIQYVKSKID